MDGGVESGGGGTKKFLYTGPTRKGSIFDENSAYTQNGGGPRHTQESSSSLNDVWSITKSININKTTAKPAAKPGTQEGWTRNVDRGFYSRHGGLTGDDGMGKQDESPENKSRTWAGSQSKSFSYSNVGGGGAAGSPTGQGPTTTDPLSQPPQQQQQQQQSKGGGRYGMQRGGLGTNNNRQF